MCLLCVSAWRSSNRSFGYALPTRSPARTQARSTCFAGSIACRRNMICDRSRAYLCMACPWHSRTVHLSAHMVQMGPLMLRSNHMLPRLASILVQSCQKWQRSRKLNWAREHSTTRCMAALIGSRLAVFAPAWPSHTTRRLLRSFWRQIVPHSRPVPPVRPCSSC